MKRAMLAGAAAALLIAAPAAVRAQAPAQEIDAPFAPFGPGGAPAEAPAEYALASSEPADAAVTDEAAPAPSIGAAPPPANDPFERVNRGLFRFNKRLDRAVIGPLARGYKAVTPSPVRKGVRNVLNNLGQPVVFANNALQGDVGRAGDTVMRFVTNSTVGVLGVFDVATGAGLPAHSEDFGQTLAKYGAPSGPYLFVPVIGPTTVRDAVGSGVDSAAHPLAWADYQNKAAVRAVAGAARGLDTRAELDGSLRELEANATDEYATVRSLYLQNRQAAIANGEADSLADLPDFGTPEPAPRTPRRRPR